MHIGLKFEVRYADSDLLLVRVSAWNGSFGGVVDTYLNTYEPQAIAAQLEGFPASKADIRELSLGELGPDFAGGAVNLRFFCVDSAGHGCVD